MDAFVTRQAKKRRLRSPSPAGPRPGPDTRRPGGFDGGDDDDDGASTEVKLAMLASLLDDAGDGGAVAGGVDQYMLLDLLLAHEGSVSAAAEAFRRRPGRGAAKKPKATAEGIGSSAGGGAIGQQTSLRALFLPPAKEKTTGPATALLSRRGRTLFLYDPVDVEAHTPCTLIHNFLPADMANDLLREMLTEAETFGPPYTFKLFDQVVSSPHTSCLFLESAAEAAAATATAATAATAGDDFVLTAGTHDGYRYNGSRLSTVRTATPHMGRARALVEAAVNAAIHRRIATHYPGGRKLRYQSPRPWRPNAAFVNCYSGAQQSVGWHSDHLTYLGPRPVIGSMSLGVAREFRVRRIVPREDGPKEPGPSKGPPREDDAAGQISIHLPHNSLLVMHAEMQEEWKHCVAPASSIDPHPIAGNRRINITYRDYRAQFHPNLTPRCRCGIATVLRVVQRKQENHGRYFWMCHAGNIPDRERCTFFQWAEFDDDGNPILKHNDKVAAQGGRNCAISLKESP